MAFDDLPIRLFDNRAEVYEWLTINDINAVVIGIVERNNLTCSTLNALDLYVFEESELIETIRLQEFNEVVIDET
jgi:hypothetical protein